MLIKSVQGLFHCLFLVAKFHSHCLLMRALKVSPSIQVLNIQCHLSRSHKHLPTDLHCQVYKSLFETLNWVLKQDKCHVTISLKLNGIKWYKTQVYQYVFCRFNDAWKQASSNQFFLSPAHSTKEQFSHVFARGPWAHAALTNIGNC